MKKLLFAFFAGLALLGFIQNPSPGTKAKDFSLPATDGKTYTTKSLHAKTTVLVFIKAKCPHTPPAIKDYNRLKKDLGKNVALVGMIDLDLAKAKAFAKQNAVTFPLVADPKADTIYNLGARHSLDMALACAKGPQTLSLYEGYSQAILAKLIKDIEDRCGTKLKIDLKTYPAEKKSGCGF